MVGVDAPLSRVARDASVQVPRGVLNKLVINVPVLDEDTVAAAGEVDAVLEGQVGAEEVVGSAVLLNDDDDVTELSRLRALGNGEGCGERSEQQNPGSEFHGKASS
jgi:hypothetical protein